jgi:tripartite-type tricarboxylate transporter receptor subunit TctC
MKIVAAALALLGLAFGAGAQYPNKPIRLVAPFAPGGTSEIVARSIAQELTTQLGQTVYVENKGGGGGHDRDARCRQVPADGYHLIIGHIGTLAVNPFAMAAQPYDVNKDFVPVALLARVPQHLRGQCGARGREGSEGIRRPR